MKTKSLFKPKRIGLLMLSLCLPIILHGCGGGSNSGGSASSEGQVLIGLTDAAGDFAQYAVDVTAIKLHKVDGTVVNAIPTNGITTVDFAQLTNMTEFMTAATVGAGAYDKVVLTLDYTNADIEVYGTDGTSIVSVSPDNITGEDGNKITTIDVTVQLDSNLLVVGGRSAHMALDFNLASNNIVTLEQVQINPSDPSATDVAHLKVTPIITADLTPDTNKTQRFRGTLQSVDTTENNKSFVITVHPFCHDLSEDDSFGTMTILVDDNTVYNIDGTNYSGTEGLTALSDSTLLGAAVVAHGAFDSNLNFVATEVLAGISVAGSLDGVKGTVISRSVDTLTLKGATLHGDRSNWGVSFRDTITVTLASTTKVSRQFSTMNFKINDISVGQLIEVFGTFSPSGEESDIDVESYSDQDHYFDDDSSSDTGTVDATNGYVRMLLTTISGKLNIPAVQVPPASIPTDDRYYTHPTWLSLSLDGIEGMGGGKGEHVSPLCFPPDTGSSLSIFDFTGTETATVLNDDGSRPRERTDDEKIADYSINPQGLDVSSLTANNMPIKMKGFMNSFGTALEDFDAQTIIDLSETEAFLNVGWGYDGQPESAVFTNYPPTADTGLVLSALAMSSGGYFHSVSREGYKIDFVEDYPNTDIIVQSDGNGAYKFILALGSEDDSWTEYTTWADFITALNAACADGAMIRHLYGRGTFNDSTMTFSTHRLILVLTTAE
jgi:hypothetical protein